MCGGKLVFFVASFRLSLESTIKVPEVLCANRSSLVGKQPEGLSM